MTPALPNFHSPFGEPARKAWFSEDFIAGLFGDEGAVRLSVSRNRTEAEQIAFPMSWEELMQVKHDCGFGDIDAVEVYPRDEDVFNTGNVRHLFLVEELPFAFRKNTHELQPSNPPEK